jgi:2,3-bisphosphoglycerate-dependent phosphoglycerate mutase
MGWDDPDHPRFDRRYAGIDPQHLPVGESLRIHRERVLACWREAILPRVMNGEEVLISAHGNSLACAGQRTGRAG